jgi:aryl-alcohol dehydrogenase-like predicted oxidoreductase
VSGWTAGREAGNRGGESETIIGEWPATRGRPDNFVIASKVGKLEGYKNLRPETIKAAAENSLRRLGVGTIDLYHAHFDDQDTPLAETLGGFGELLEAGKVRCVALQSHYNLMEREFEADERPVCEREDIPVFPFFSLAKGFLTGKYRPGGEAIDSPRAGGAAEYLDERGEQMLAALDEIAATHGVAPASVAVAWLREQPTVPAPIASARTPEQLAPLLASVDLDLSSDELAQLTAI